MRQQLATATRVFYPAYLGAMVWVLAGCGWGVVIGSALEAAFGQGADGLIDAAGEISLEAVAGALLGMIGFTLVAGCGHVATLVPGFYLIGKGCGRFPHNNPNLGLMHERSARVGLLTSFASAVINGTWAGPLLGAACLLESIHGNPVPRTFIQGGTLGGLLVGGIVGLATMTLAIYRGMPESWREELRRGMCPARPAAGASGPSFR
jgi:hypothetical protein